MGDSFTSFTRKIRKKFRDDDDDDDDDDDW
jgi:hypothetical protein